jgi:Holliday junction resolvasome RuvABC endonuclease subunit
MSDRVGHSFVIAIYPNSNGIAFVVFEGPQSLVDWGGRGATYKHSHRRLLKVIAALLDQYHPAILILQNMKLGGTSRNPRIRKLNTAIASLANEREVAIHSYSRQDVQKAFAPLRAATKAGIAEAIAKQVPPFARLVPPPRKPWHSEHRRMGLFDAAALALTFFHDRAAHMK